MSQVITNAFASYWQACLTDELPVVLDAFVLANIPDLNPDVPISPDDGLPPAAHIVYRQAVDQRGRINLDAVAYTIVMDTRVGDFEFNAMYLINAETSLVGMIVHKGVEAKLKTDEASGQTGNSLVKSMLMEYDRASLATVTTVDASTWQIDYAARLAGMDEDMRRLTLPLYGPAWFEGNGFEVFNNAGVFHVRPGDAVVGGLLAMLSDDHIVVPDALPMGVWVDVQRAGSLLGAWENHVTLVLSNTALVDYTDSGGYQHRVAQVATINSDSSVTDTRRQRSHNHYWDEILDPLPLPTPEGIGALPEAAYTPRTDSLNNQQGVIAYTQNKDLDTCLAGEFGLYEKATCANSPAGADNYFYCETKSIYSTGALIQIAWPYDGLGVLAWRNFSLNAHAWDALWREGYDTGHKPTPADIGAAPAVHAHPGSALNPIALSTEDLDTVVTPGFYAQSSNANTSTERHYPEVAAGSLCVESGAGTIQTYHVYNSSRVWTRAKYSSGAWTAWAREYNTLNKPTAADIGASPAGHTHTAGEVGAAPVTHTHTASQGNADVIAGSYGHVGSYAFASNISGTIKGIGATVPGSGLVPASAGERYQDGVSLPGTWKCLGFSFDTSGPLDTRATLWIRIA